MNTSLSPGQLVLLGGRVSCDIEADDPAAAGSPVRNTTPGDFFATVLHFYSKTLLMTILELPELHHPHIVIARKMDRFMFTYQRCNTQQKSWTAVGQQRPIFTALPCFE
jgi:hypothetical protein